MTNKAYGAASIAVTSVGSQVIIGNTTVQNINVDINKQSAWSLYITPLDNGLINISDPTKVIPLSRLTLTDSTGSNIYTLNYGVSTLIGSGTNYGTDNIPYKFVLENSSIDYPGTYTSHFQFQLISGKETVSTTYTLTITVLPTQTITLSPATLNINVNSSGLLQANYSQETATPEVATLNSNIPWNLILRANTASNGIKYEFKVLSVPSGATTPYGSGYYTYNNVDTTIVTGTTPVESGIVEINYRITINQNGIQPAGVYAISIPYVIMP